jgi:hypothetical protein
MTPTPTLAEAIRVVRLVAKTIVIGPELTLVADMAEKAELLSDANRKANGMIGSYADEAKTLAAENARLRAQVAELAEACAALADRISDEEEHGDAYPDCDCPVCNAIIRARAALANTREGDAG